MNINWIKSIPMINNASLPQHKIINNFFIFSIAPKGFFSSFLTYLHEIYFQIKIILCIVFASYGLNFHVEIKRKKACQRCLPFWKWGFICKTINPLKHGTVMKFIFHRFKIEHFWWCKLFCIFFANLEETLCQTINHIKLNDFNWKLIAFV